MKREKKSKQQKGIESFQKSRGQACHPDSVARPVNCTQTDNVFLEDFLAIKRNREKYYVFNLQFLLVSVVLDNLPYY